MSRLLIIGAGGHGAVVSEAAAESQGWANIVFLDDASSGGTISGFPVVGSVDQLRKETTKGTETIVAVGNNMRRIELLDGIAASHCAIATVTHPSAIISLTANIAPGTVVCAGAIVNARAKVGRGSILNTACTIDHDCMLGDGVHVSPGANIAGKVSVGSRTWIGIGAAVKEGVRIGKDCVVGAGAAVVSDVADGSTVVGVPARELLKT